MNLAIVTWIDACIYHGMHEHLEECVVQEKRTVGWVDDGWEDIVLVASEMQEDSPCDVTVIPRSIVTSIEALVVSTP